MTRKQKSDVLSRWMSLWMTLVLVLCMVTGASLTSAAQTGKTPGEEIVILYTNDVHCAVDENIGYAGLALYKQQMQRHTPFVTLVDAGDAIQGAPIGTLSDGTYLVDIMNQVGYDVAIPGNHEFDYGMEHFLNLAGQLKCGYISCNFMSLSTGETVFRPYQMLSYGDIQVAYVGVTTPESFTKSTPLYFQDGNGNYIYTFCEDSSGQKLYGQVQKTVDEARTAGADYVILVSHLGEEGSTDQWTSEAVLKNTQGIDACIDGHSHETIPGEIVKNKEGQNVILSQTGAKLAHIGKMTIHTDGSITTELVSKVEAEEEAGAAYTVQPRDTLKRIAGRELGSYNRWREIYDANRQKISDPNRIYPGMLLTIPGKSSVNEAGKAVDYRTDRFIKDIQAQYQETLKTVLGHTEHLLAANHPETGVRLVRNTETNLGNLCADAYRYMLEADIGFINGGGIRAEIKTGDITYNDTLQVFPYGNMGCVVEATGQQIKDALEMASRNYPEESGAFLHVSGLTYTIDTGVPSSVQVDEKGGFVKVNGSYRVTDIKVGDQPIDLNKTYTVASHNYMLKSAGDGMNMFQSCRIIRDETMVDVDVLSGYINQYMGGIVGEAYSNPMGEGRIRIK